MPEKTQSQLARQLLQKAVWEMAGDYPGYAHLLSMERFSPEPAVKTMAVALIDGEVRFKYAPEFIFRCSHGQRKATIHHEINHWELGHLHADPANYPDRTARIIAEEVTANEFVPEPLYGQPYTLDMFELPPGESTDERYKRLAGRGLELPWPPMDPHAWLGEQVDETDSIENLMQRILAGRRRAGSTPGRLQSLKAGENASSRRKAMNRNRASKKPINWYALLGPLTPWERTAVFHRPPRRYPAEFTGIVPAYTHRPKPLKVMAAIDTSGSVRPPMIEQICKEIEAIHRLGNEVVVVECDVKIQATYPYRKPIEEVQGGGGTDLRPPFEESVLAKENPNVVVYFTDGRGRVPNQTPNVPVVWCITPGGRVPCSWGRSARMAV